MKYKIKILHLVILLFTGIALIGVNITKMHCTHCDGVHVRVESFSAKCECPCDGECQCQKEGSCTEGACSVPQSHDYYKITDASEVERGLEIIPLQYELSIIWIDNVWFPGTILEKYHTTLFYTDPPDLLLSEELLCTYLC